MRKTTFIGVDFAWQSERNATGIAVACGDKRGADVVHIASGVRGLDDVIDAVEQHAAQDTVVAIDAPLIIRNETGRRRCETEISRRFGAKHASAHSSNLTLYPDPRTHALVRQLEEIGFRHEVRQERVGRGRWFFEVYPHPAHVVLFELETILKYKAKSRRLRALRLSEFARLKSLLVSLEQADPPLYMGAAAFLVSTDLQTLRGQGLKDHEDALDAWFCAYLALHVWYWGAERNEVVGDFESGYIVLPTGSHR
jgi:predicted RNase H-like nuclease